MVLLNSKKKNTRLWLDIHNFTSNKTAHAMLTTNKMM